MREQNKQKTKKNPDDFASVAARLECDPDLKKFDAKLVKIVKKKPARKGN